MKNKGAKQKLKRKGAASAFGCDLTEYLESSGQDGNVPPPPFLFKSDGFSWGMLDAVHKLMCSRLVRSLYFKKKKKYTILKHYPATPTFRRRVCPSDVS